LLATACLALGADPQLPGDQPPRQPQAAPPAAAPAARLDGAWSVVYAERAGRRVDLGPSVELRGGTLSWTQDGRTVGWRLEFGPGYTLQALPAGSAAPAAGTAGRATAIPGAMQGVFVMTQEFLVLSLNPTGTDALGASPGSTAGGDVGPGAAPGTGVERAAVPPGTGAPAPSAAGGVRHDAFVLILRRGR
jgi:hypothetical protein